MQVIKKYADNRQSNSLATGLRRKRFALFLHFLSLLPQPVSILDVGGTQKFWETMEFTGADGVKVVLLNLSAVKVTYPHFESVVGNATRMDEFERHQFDVVFSNSVIEHVGDFDAQCQMAAEVRRVGRRYFIQTPNRFFPIEPHFLFPFFQFLPVSWRVFLVTHFNMGWYKRIADKQKAREEVTSVRLLTQGQLRKMFPHATIGKEKLFGFTKSFVVYEGWDSPTAPRDS